MAEARARRRGVDAEAGRCNVLLPISGRKSYLCEILRGSTRCGAIVAADADPQATIRAEATAFVQVPVISQAKDYIEALLALCRRYAIHCVMPQNDMDLSLLAAERSAFVLVGSTVLGVDDQMVRVLSDKLAISSWLRDRGFDYPETVLAGEAELESMCLPVVAKAREGQGSAGLKKCSTSAELAALAGDVVVQPFIDGLEYNLDILRSQEDVVAVVPKRKIEMVHGSTDKAISVADERLLELGVALGNAVGHVGTIDVDVLVAGPRAFVIDINPRMGGGFPFTAHYCPRFVDALLAIGLGESPKPFLGDYRVGVLVCRDSRYIVAGSSEQAG